MTRPSLADANGGFREKSEKEGRPRHQPNATKILRAVGDIPGSSRKSWRVSIVEEAGQQFVELRLYRRWPDGSSTPTGHRSVIRPESAYPMAKALLLAADAVCTPEKRDRAIAGGGKWRR